jgi:hypothetical protein
LMCANNLRTASMTRLENSPVAYQHGLLAFRAALIQPAVKPERRGVELRHQRSAHRRPYVRADQ